LSLDQFISLVSAIVKYKAWICETFLL
jgi:hypothetical protein